MDNEYDHLSVVDYTEMMEPVDLDPLEAADAAPEEVKVDVIPGLEAIDVDIKPMLAALSCASKEQARYYLCGVFLHCVDDALRIVATDGHRMFIHARPRETGETFPAWLTAGVIIPAAGLSSKLKMLGSTARVAYADGARRIELSDFSDECTFRVSPVDGSFPAYQRILDSLKGFEGHEVGDLAATAFASKYLKAAGELATILGSAQIRAHATTGKGGDPDPTLFTFPESPGSVLILMPVRDTVALPAATASLLSAPINSTIAALKAHRTRWEKKGGTVGKAKVKQYDIRIAALMSRVSMLTALPAPESEPEVTAVPETSAYAITHAIDPEPVAEPAADPDGEQAGTARYRKLLPPTKRTRAWLRFQGDLNGLLSREHGLTISQLVVGVPVEEWFDAGLSAVDAAKRCTGWLPVKAKEPETVH